MTREASVPEPAEWLTAAIRGVHPVRWALCLAALAVTGVVAAGVQTLFDGQPPRWVGWWEDPAGQVSDFGSHIPERSNAAIWFRLGFALAVVSAVWTLAGAWVARHELLARLRGRPDVPYSTPSPGPSGLVAGKLKQLVLCCPLVLILATVFLMPLLVATAINGIPGVGPIVVAVLLPVVLVGDLIFLVLLFGILAWPLMAVTIAAESSDTFDALSRSYNYSFAKPIRFLFFLALSLVVAALPFVAVIYALDGPFAGWPPVTRQVVLFLAAGLSASVFWSVQTVVYLHLRVVVDDTDTRHLAGAETPTAVAEQPAASVPEKSPLTAAPAAAAARFGPLGLLILSFLLVVATWFGTAWLFMRSGGEDAQWIGWGMFDGFVPPAPGVRGIAAMLAGLWAVMWLALPFFAALRGLRQRESPPESPAAESKDAAPGLV